MVTKDEPPESASGLYGSPTPTGEDNGLVSWDGPQDPENPPNWSWQRKWVATILVSCFTFISPFSSTMVTPVLDEISTDLGI